MKKWRWIFFVFLILVMKSGEIKSKESDFKKFFYQCKFENCAQSELFPTWESLCHHLKKVVFQISGGREVRCQEGEPKEDGSDEMPETVKRDVAVYDETYSVLTTQNEEGKIRVALLTLFYGAVSNASSTFLVTKDLHGWRVVRELGGHDCVGAFGQCEEFEIKRFEVKKFRSEKNPILLIESKWEGRDLDYDRSWYTSYQQFVFCQLTEHPFCYAAVPLIFNETDEIVDTEKGFNLLKAIDFYKF